jgi:hypothetical protein
VVPRWIIEQPERITLASIDGETDVQVRRCYVDGFGAFRKTNGVFRAVGWVADSGAVLNLIVSLTGADQANHEARRILDEKPVQTIGVLGRFDAGALGKEKRQNGRSQRTVSLRLREGQKVHGPYRPD